jgi:oligopeptide/dipeptide ABC transporter ATP-binding protein
MIFQEPMVSLNPLFTIGNQLSEVINQHQPCSKAECRRRVIEMLDMVGIPSPETRLKQYPFELSGGMRQRVMISMALLCRPQVLIADEPTTALDVTIQAQILDLLQQLNKELGTSIILITHDLGIIAEVADRVAVMYAGNIVETAPVKELFSHPLHPYTKGLLKSIPTMDDSERPLETIEGMVPSIYHLPSGCLFQNRCEIARDICRSKIPPVTGDAGHLVKCFQYSDCWK